MDKNHRVRTLAEALDPRQNSLNAIRLALAIGVIGWHSFPLTGTSVTIGAPGQLMSDMFVDAFFAISGYLISSSWIRNPIWSQFVRSRFLRIMPGFWCNLLVTAFVFAPLSFLLLSHRLPTGFGHSAVGYFTNNALLSIRQYGIVGSPKSVPYPKVWNGSLWTLWWEVMCYLSVLILGLLRFFRYKFTIPVLFGVALAGSIYVVVHRTGNYYLDHGPRFALMFLSGAVLLKYQDRIKVSWPLVVAASITVLSSSFLPDYRLLGALPVAYACIATGALAKRPSLRNDISYGVYVYAFPVQQMLAVMGGWKLGAFPFFVIATFATLPVAAASWFLVERPLLKLKTLRLPWTARSKGAIAQPTTPLTRTTE